jgi:hypothetical protein
VAAGIAQEWEKENLAARPRVRFEHWQLFYWEAWNALRYDRLYIGQHGDIEMPISWVAVDAYARRHGIDGLAFDALLKFVSVIDFAYLDLRAEERSMATPKAAADSESGAERARRAAQSQANQKAKK